jgi:hypothetical protein
MFTIKKFITEHEIVLNNYNKNKNDRIKRLFLKSYIELVFAHYTLTQNKEKVKKPLLQAIHFFNDVFVFDDGYMDCEFMIRFLSLGILCDIDIKEFKKIIDVIKRDGAKDKLIDFLIKFKDSTWQGNSNTYIQEHPYKSIDSLLNETDNAKAIEKIKFYLDKKWYQGHSDAYWHDNHKNKNVNRYHGYWSFEVAAVVKILGIDDNELQNQKYYPYDAVHFNDEIV